MLCRAMVAGAVIVIVITALDTRADAFDEMQSALAAGGHDARFHERIWRGNTGLARYTSGSAERWYLVETDDTGAVVWLRSSSQPRAKYVPEAAHGADVATTAAGLALGAGESNPLGAPGVAAMKLAALVALRAMPVSRCYAAVDGLSAAGWAASAWNLAVLSGAPPIALGGVALAMPGMTDDEKFWACAPRWAMAAPMDDE